MPMNSDHMTQADLEAKAKQAVLGYQKADAEAVAKQAIAEGADLVGVIENGFTAGIQEVGELFAQKKLFLPHIMAAAAAMTAGIDILKPELGGKTAGESKGKFVIATIEGDIHSIGKDIVAIMLGVAGFEVLNLGRDIPCDDIVKACIDNKADIVGSSALMTSTMVNQKTLETKLKAAGIRGSIITNVGGAPVSQDWADQIGADVYSENANDCVKKILEAVGD